MISYTRVHILTAGVVLEWGCTFLEFSKNLEEFHGQRSGFNSHSDLNF